MRRPKNDTTRHPPCPCPACGTMVDAASPAETTKYRKVRPGDISICLYCGVRLKFTRSMQLRLLTDREWMKLHPDHRKLIERIQIGREAVARKDPTFPRGHVPPTKVQ